MPIRQPFYLNADNLSSATAVFLDAALTMCAPNGFYSDGNIVRELVDCVLLPLQQCPSCCSQPCTSWNVVGNQGPFSLKYGRCGIPPGVVVEDYPDLTDVDICVAYGDVPNVTIGNAVLTINQNCGCCASPCEQWSITNVTESVTVSYTSCDGTAKSKNVNVGLTGNFCIQSGTLPVIDSGVAIVQFDFCDCID
jgi:hypothetical protein